MRRPRGRSQIPQRISAENRHQNGQRLVDVPEQSVERQRKKNQDDAAEKVAEDSESEQCFVREDVVGGGGGVARNEELAGNDEEAQRGRDGEQEIEDPRNPGIPDRQRHGIFPLMV